MAWGYGQDYFYLKISPSGDICEQINEAQNSIKGR
jgi:hypothetical protein